MKRCRSPAPRTCLFLFLMLIMHGTVPVANAGERAFMLLGEDFAGGGKDRYGALWYGQKVNFVYALPTGPLSMMRAVFTCERIPAEPMFLHLKARDDDGPGICDIEVLLNGRALFRGPNGFAEDRWQVKRFAIPDGCLRKGVNELTISNQEAAGTPGMPPWFMAASCAAAPEDYILGADITKDFFVPLPEVLRPLPEALEEGREPGFRIRGIKGWMWRPDQYLAEIPFLVECRMNFLMNCYGSMFDLEHFPLGDRRVNRWWEPLPKEKRKAYEEVVRACREAGIAYCFSMNPNLCTNRIMNYQDPGDVDLLFRHYDWMQKLGVQWFNISLDDISEGIDASGQSSAVNEIHRRLRTADPECRMIFCPTWYFGDGMDERARPYLETLARELDPEIYLFWTGDQVVGRITRECAESYRSIVQHRLFLWDNYPVNDNHPTMHLGPVIGRDPDLCEVIDGYMSNPMCSQNEANRIPLFTCADYAFNPWAYDPARSIGQAVLHLAESEEERRALKDLVEAYPGMLFYGRGTGFNAVREQYTRLASAPHSRHIARMYLVHLQELAERMNRIFPGRFMPAGKTLARDIRWIRQALSDRYGGNPE